MTSVVIGGDRSVLLTHMAFYGLAAILEEAGVRELRLSWREGTATLDASDLDASVVDDVVRDHARSRTTDASWVRRDETIDGSVRGLMSPRLTVFKTDGTWRLVQGWRHGVLDDLTTSRSWLDLTLLGALGEPCYWSHDPKGNGLQDDGASRFEMQPRNRGSEFVTNRLRPLAAAVGRRATDGVVAGIDGTTPIDELGKGESNAVIATGLSVPGPVDNALVWCALWGIASMPIAPRTNRTAVTSGHVGRSRSGWFYAPVWRGSLRPARLRSLLASEDLRVAAAKGSPGPSATPTEELAAAARLHARRVDGVVRFEVRRFGSDNAPERRAMYGENVALAGRR